MYSLFWYIDLLLVIEFHPHQAIGKSDNDMEGALIALVENSLGLSQSLAEKLYLEQDRYPGLGNNQGIGEAFALLVGVIGFVSVFDKAFCDLVMVAVLSGRKSKVGCHVLMYSLVGGR
jgi:hypothetical protein